MFYKQRVLANFWGRKDSANCASRKRKRCMLLRCAYETSDKQFVYADHAVFTISLFGTYVQVGPTSMLLLYQYFCQHLYLIKLIQQL